MAEHNKKGTGPLTGAAAKLGKAGGNARDKSISQQREVEIARMGGEAKSKGTAHQRGQKGGKKK